MESGSINILWTLPQAARDSYTSGSTARVWLADRPEVSNIGTPFNCWVARFGWKGRTAATLHLGPLTTSCETDIKHRKNEPSIWSDSPAYHGIPHVMSAVFSVLFQWSRNDFFFLSFFTNKVCHWFTCKPNGQSAFSRNWNDSTTRGWMELPGYGWAVGGVGGRKVGTLNQPASQLVSQPTDRPTTKSANQPTNQPTKRVDGRVQVGGVVGRT